MQQYLPSVLSTGAHDDFKRMPRSFDDPRFTASLQLQNAIMFLKCLCAEDVQEFDTWYMAERDLLKNTALPPVNAEE